MQLAIRFRMRRFAGLLLLPALVLGSGAVFAEGMFVGDTQLILTDVEQALVEENPILQDLAAASPENLREALDLIAAALEERHSSRGGLTALDRDIAPTFDRNPVLLQVWQSSPEASADLLALIRTAAGGGKSQK